MMISDIAQSFVGTPYRHQGRVPGMGLDCAGVLVCALQAAGIPVNDCRTYQRVPPRNMLRDVLELHGFRKVNQQPKTGDVLLFWIRHKRLVIHCGVCTGSRFVHVEEGRNVESVSMDVWGRYMDSAYRIGATKWRS